MIRAVIVDFDDTLCLTREAGFAVENEALRRMGRPPTPLEIHAATWGMPLYEAIALRSPGVDVEEYKKVFPPVLQEFAAAGKLDAIPDQNYAALDELMAQGKSIMLLTARTHSEFKHLLSSSRNGVRPNLI